MLNIHIVTDSCLQISGNDFIQPQQVTVVANTLLLANQTYLEGVDLDTEAAMKLIAQEQFPPRIVSPDTAQFLEVYNRLIGTCDGVISIHPSRKLFPSWENARAAAKQVGGHFPIEVIDSQTVSAGQTMLVRVALNAIRDCDNFDAVVRQVRGAVDRIYTIYYLESVDVLLQNKVMSSSHAILGAMLGIKPFLTIEEGALGLIEKVKTRSQAVERLVEFVVEFMDIDDVMILHHKSNISDQARQVQDRLAFEFPGRHFPNALYGASLASLIGLDATGIVVLESEMDSFEDDF